MKSAILLLALLLTACGPKMPPTVKPTPPLVTDCLTIPQGRLAKPPAPPAELTDTWAKAMWKWASDTIGLVQTDRKEWQGERNCIRGKAETGAIR